MSDLKKEHRGTAVKKGPIAWMASHSVAANLLMVVLLAGGFILAGNVKKEVFPDFDLDIVSIGVAYPGASPEEVELGIILSIEDAVDGISGVSEINSTASEGMGQVSVEVLEGEDIQAVAQEIRNEVDRISSFPEDAEKPVISIASRNRYVISLALYGDQDDKVLRETAEMVRDRLTQDENITQVELSGAKDYEISIEIPQQSLRAYGLTLQEVASTVAKSSVELPGGAIKTRGGDILVRVNERRDFGAQFEKIPIITGNDGTKLLLGDIGNIKDGFAEDDNFASFNGKPAIMMSIYRVGDQTPVAVASAARLLVEEINPALPGDMKIECRNDRSEIYTQRMDLMMRNGLMGLVLVFVLLAMFLEPGLAFWVSLGIPISILGSFFLIPAMGVSINLISMFAFIITLGIVVDDAIVAGENMYHHRQSGSSWMDAAVNGARQIAVPVTFSVMTNMIAFMPMLFIPGFMGKVFKQIPVVVIAVFAVSLVESLFILPAHIAHQKNRSYSGFMGRLHRKQQKFSQYFSLFIQNRYGPFLIFVLRYRYVTFCAGFSILLITVGFVNSGRLGFELFPKIESDFSMVTAVVPYGSSVEKTRIVEKRLVDAVEKAASKNGGDKLLEGVYANVKDNIISIRAYLTPPHVRPVSTAALTRSWRSEVGTIPGIESIKFESDAGGPGRGAVISVELSHRDPDIIEAAGKDIAGALASFPGIKDIDDGIDTGKRQIDFRIRPEALSLGLTTMDVARQLRHAYYGAEAIRQQRGRNEIKVMVRLPRDQRRSEMNLENMVFLTPDKREIPLLEAVDIERGTAYTKIRRKNGRRIITVTADINPRSRAGQVVKALKEDVLPEIHRHYPGLTTSFEGRQADRRESMQSLIRGLLAALVIIYAMLAIPFNSFLQPMIIMVAVPFGIVGAVAGHIIMGYSLSVMSMFGVVALSGVVINDSLVMIDFANRRRRKGDAADIAIMESGIIRFRPILLTTLTTFGGLAPMIFETSRQARFLIPMAISLGFGILFGTMIILVLVPSLYLIVDDIIGAAGSGR